MLRLARLALLAGLALVACASPLRAADAPAADTPLAALERAAAAEPDDPTLAYFLAFFRARAGQRDGALDALERTLANGDGFLPTDQFFAPLVDDARFAVMRARFEKRLPKRTDGRVAFRLRDRALIPEGIAYDPVGRRFYVGSIARRAIYRIGDSGNLQRFSPANVALDPILGIAVDANRRRLYAVATSALTAEGRRERRNHVHAFEIPSGRLLATYEVRDAVQLNDVAITPDGDLYATDSAGGGVWRIEPSTGRVTPRVALGTLNGANGIAIPPVGGVAYVAASRRVVRVDLATGAFVPLALPPRANSAAIDGLYWHDGALLGVQNVTNPARIVRLALAPDGRSVAAVETLQSHHHAAFDEPTTAAVAPDGLYVLARTYVTRFNERGEIDGAARLEPPLVLRVPLRVPPAGRR